MRRSRIRIPAAVVSAAVLFLVASGLANAEPTWALQPAPPAPAAFKDTYVADVSCKTNSSCLAVGYWLSSGSTSATTHPLAYSWRDGVGWSTLDPPNAGDALFSGVSCAAKHSCVAVGSHFNQQGRYTAVAERWTGGATWQLDHVPVASSQLSPILNKVSCSATNACTAVGSFVRSSTGRTRPLIERWDGAAWTRQNVTDLFAGAPEPAQTEEFVDVSCPSATWCVAVGNWRWPTDVSTQPRPIVATWDGNAWQENYLNIGFSDSATVASVSCTSPSDCFAVGKDYSHDVALLDHWDGHAWSEADYPRAPSLAYAYNVLDISCASSSACVVVGQYLTDNDVAHALAESWNGAVWTVADLTSWSSPASLTTVSCSAAQTCTAIGFLSTSFAFARYDDAAPT